MRYFSSSIGKKIIVPYALLTLILAGLGVFIVVRLVAVSFEARLKNQLLDAAQTVADEVVYRENVRLEVERSVAGTIGVAEAIVNRDTDKLAELISPLITNASAIDSIIVVDTQGKELLRLRRLGMGQETFVEAEVDSGLDLSILPVVREVLASPMAGKSIQLVEDAVSNETIVYTVGPVMTAEGVIGAALVGTYLRRDLAYLQNSALAQLIVFNSQGEVLASTFAMSREELEQAFDFFSPARYQEVIANEDIILLDQVALPEAAEAATDGVTIKGQGYRLAYAPFKLRNEVFGVYGVALPTNFITDTTDQSRNTLIVLFSVGGALVFGIGYVISRRISQPILKLVQTSLAISSGDLNQRTGLEQEDEIGILATAFDDMTAELQRLLKIQEEEASKLNAILSSIADGVVVLDMEGAQLVVNPAAEKILKDIQQSFAQQQLMREIIVDQVEGVQISANPEALLAYLSQLEFREAHRFEAGRNVLSALSAPVVTPEGVQLGSVIVLRDITREFESEKLKDDFITSMSHELRTPLTAIKGYNELLKLTGQDRLDERQLEYIETIGDNVDDLLEIIQQMLDLSQIDAGNLGIDHEPLDIVGLVEDEAANWSAKMEERELHFSLHIPKTAIWVEGDHNRLSRVMHNLIKNAYSYTLPGGTVAVGVAKHNGVVAVNVTDTGVGISADNQRFLFTRFFRAIHQEHTFEVSGAGLGLYTSKAIIEAHGGKLEVQSKLNEGSRFWFTLSTIQVDGDEAGN